MLKDGPTRGVGSRFENCPKSRIWIAVAQAGEGFANGRWMVAEIVDDGDPIHFAANFLPALDALECCQRFLDLRHRHAVEVRRLHRHRGVAYVEIAHQGDFKGGVK